MAIISISDLEPQRSESVLDAENLSPEELALKGGTDIATGLYTPPEFTYIPPLTPTPPPLRRRLVKIADSVRVVYY